MKKPLPRLPDNRSGTFFFLLLLLSFTSACIRLEDSPKYQFVDGVYRAKIQGVPTARMYVEVEDDSIQLFPLLPAEKGVVIDSTQGVILLFPEQKAHDAFHRQHTYSFQKPSFDLDLITIPFKYRSRSAGFPRQLKSSLEAALYVGYRSDTYRLLYRRTPLNLYERDINRYGFSLGLFTGLGSTDMSPWVTQDQIAYEYDGVIWTKGIAGMMAVNNFTVGVALGTDWLLDRNRRVWIYQSRPWVGLVFGLNLN
jgi:hypothetical protein